MENRHPLRLFHCFPRPALAKGDDLGLRALRLFFERGAVLTPEERPVPSNWASPRTTPDSRGFRQHRLSLTLSTRERLSAKTSVLSESRSLSHFDVFGDWGIGLDAHRARLIGAVPVFYFYPSSDGQHRDVLAGYSEQLLYRLREMRTLFVALAHLEAITRLSDRYYLSTEALEEEGPPLGRDLSHEPDVMRALERVDRASALRILELFDTDRVPAWNLADWVDLLAMHLQVADSKKESYSLQYIQQAEWRMIRIITDEARCYSLSDRFDHPTSFPRREIRDQLSACNPGYFTSEKLDDCWLLEGAGSLHFRDVIEEVVAPRHALDSVRRLLGDCMPQAQFVCTDLDEDHVAMLREPSSTSAC